ncbi:hypothetical protein IW140_002668 [Coemansia sp. RSA 1813]|nr:hypothetical protein EV178_000256 [Coemansia sp. RSA 1646]KAJ1767352.1 hypothetical protein LPJ74_005426 [Coemansia sp. RSA 1843]KAJ2090436.1 hypothetical protein IW138_002647 [Coemansia sp. RSA 986]KAJ2215403.1 hypothetical protein EV179_002187 [Coemansia sp. RSA 487]KAJ2569992.1 hypothetical protein IW140_002668 [Coemansia sp. RSA 1813]
MPNPHHTFPRLQTSPNVRESYRSNPHTPDSHTFALDGGYCSLPHTPRSHRDPHTPGQRRSIWTTMRRDRQSRIHSIIEARQANAHTPVPGIQDSAGFLSVKDLPKAIRLRARDSGWLVGQRTKARAVRISELADALRTTSFDEDDVVIDSLLAAERAGASFDPIEQSADFDAIQEIVALRRAARILLRLQLEHPNPATRQAVDDVMAKINSPKKKLKLPVPQPLASGPSFFLPAAKFALEKQLNLIDGLDMDDGSLSSSSEEPSDYEDEGFGAHPGASENSYAEARWPGSSNASVAAAAFAASVSRRGSRTGITVDQEAQAAHLAWVRKYAEYSNTHWEYGAPHLFQLLNPLPQCGFAMAGTFESMFRVQRSSIKEPEACYLLATAAAQVRCYPLVCLAEERVVASCYDDGDIYETWLSQGISASSAKIQLLARFGMLLSARPWAIAAQDVKHYVDEYVRIHSETLMHQIGRQRGDSGNGTLLAHRTVQRSLSTSVVSGAPTVAAPKLAPLILSEFSRKSLEENAIRDLLHCIMVMAVGHGLGSFASACGIAPDLDQSAGSFFGHIDMLAPVEIVAGLSYIQPPPSPVFSSHRENGEPQQQRQQEQRQQAWVPPMFVDQVERNTADLIFRLQFGTPPESAAYPNPTAQIYSSYSASHPQHQNQHRQFIPQPPASMLRHISGPRMYSNFFMRSLGTLNDPMESSAPQFVAYRHMQSRKLARYELPEKQQQSQSTSVDHQSFVCVQVLEGGVVPSTSACVSATTSPTSPLQMVHRVAHNIGHTSLHEASDVRMPAAPRSVHLSQREDLRWDVLTSYLQQQLSINDDHLGNEVQTARSMTGRPFVEAAAPLPQEDDHNVFLADTRNAPLKSEATKPEWERSIDAIGGENTSDLKAKSFSLSGALSLGSIHHDKGLFPGPGSSEASHRAHMNTLSLTSRSIDVRRFHDAIWHFTMSLYHIYEEYYFYNQYKNETTPDNSQNEMLAGSSIPVPVQSPYTTTTDAGSMDIDYESEMGNMSGYLSAGEKPQDFNIWLTEELKSHIRSVVRSSDTVSAFSAQPSVATGLNLCAEEMVLINLIISLAKRQAEIIHGIRAIREYEQFIGDY